jgi:hypothetical protein
VEAASYRNQPVSFEVIGPWTRPTRLAPVQPPPIDLALQGIFVAAVVALILFALIVARRNVQGNRADRRGALRLVWYVLAVGFMSWAIGAHHVLDGNALLDSFFRSFGQVLLFGAVLWVIYVAVEPYVRRFWPDSLLGWSRLLAGHVRDPRVGRDALIGLLFGVALALVEVVRVTLLPWLGYPAPRPPFGMDVEMLSAGLWQAASWMTASMSDTMEGLFTVLLIVALRLLLRRNWLVIPVTVFIVGLMSARYVSGSAPWLFLFPLVSGAVLTFVVMRYGLLSLVVTRLVWGLLLAGPLTLDVGHWSATASNATILLLSAMAIFAFYAARAGQPVFGTVAPRQASGSI